jgi:hypothetical protein
MLRASTTNFQRLGHNPESRSRGTGNEGLATRCAARGKPAAKRAGGAKWAVSSPQLPRDQRIVLLAMLDDVLSTFPALYARTVKYQVAGARFSTTALVSPAFGSSSVVFMLVELVP